MSKKYYLTYLMLCFTSIIISQNCNLIFRGVITDFHDGTPISGAYIKVEGSKLYGISDNKGSFIYVLEGKTVDKKASKAYVNTGYSFDDQTEIVSGLSEHQMIVDKGYRALTQGTLVEITVDK